MANLPFKIVAVDMDGTFLRPDSTYNREYFRRILTKLKENHIHFIITSGRPLIRLRIDFREFLNQIDLIADNGAILVQDGHVINSRYFNTQTRNRLIAFLNENYPGTPMIADGLDNTFITANSPIKMKNFMNFIYHGNLMTINDLREMPNENRIAKITLQTDVSAEEMERKFNNSYTGQIHSTTSGMGYMDIIPYGVNKGSGLSYFLRYFNIKPEEVIAFGDSMNDVEILKLAGYSYAMANAEPALKQYAKYSAPSNKEDGVLKVLDSYLDPNKEIIK